MTKTYSVNAKNQLASAWPIAVFFVGAFVLPFTLIESGHNQSSLSWLPYSFGAFLCVLLPHLILHLRYLSVSLGWQISIDSDKGSIEFVRENEKYTYYGNEISSVELHVPRPLLNDTLQWFPWHGYSYAVLRFNTGEQFTITSLQVPMLHSVLNLENQTTKETLYSWPPRIVIGHS